MSQDPQQRVEHAFIWFAISSKRGPVMRERYRSAMRSSMNLGVVWSRLGTGFNVWYGRSQRFVSLSGEMTDVDYGTRATKNVHMAYC